VDEKMAHVKERTVDQEKEILFHKLLEEAMELHRAEGGPTKYR
jgi:hypothetical protein